MKVQHLINENNRIMLYVSRNFPFMDEMGVYIDTHDDSLKDKFKFIGFSLN